MSPLRPNKKEVSLPSTRSRCRLHQIFGATKFGFHPAPCVTRVRIWISCRQYHPYLLDRYQSNICSIAAKARLWIWCLCFFFSPIVSIIHTCSIAAGARLWIWHLCFFFSPSAVPSILARLLLEQDCGFIIPMDYFLQLAFETGLSKPFCVQCTSSLSNKKMTLFYFANLSFSAIIVL